MSSAMNVPVRPTPALERREREGGMKKEGEGGREGEKEGGIKEGEGGKEGGKKGRRGVREREREMKMTMVHQKSWHSLLNIKLKIKIGLQKNLGTINNCNKTQPLP